MSYSSLMDSDELSGLVMDSGLAAEFLARWGAGGNERTHSLARAWIEESLGMQLKGQLQQELKSGVLLCNLINRVKPGCCTKPYVAPSGYPTEQTTLSETANVTNYLAAAAKLGVSVEVLSYLVQQQLNNRFLQSGGLVAVLRILVDSEYR